MAKAKKKAEQKTYGAKVARELEQELVDDTPIEALEEVPEAAASDLVAPPEALPALAQIGDQLLIPGVEPEPEPAHESQRYAFPTAVRCPRCKTLDNERYSQHEDTQYRRCRRSVCRKTFAVIGKLA
jgi:phage FluMu protein Com